MGIVTILIDEISTKNKTTEKDKVNDLNYNQVIVNAWLSIY